MTTHQHNLQLLVKNLNPTFMKNISAERDVQYNLRSKNHLQLPNVKTAKYGIENIQHIGLHLWVSLPEEIKDSGILRKFKQKIKPWKGSTCIRKLCKIYINGVGSLELISISLKENCIIFLFLLFWH